MKQSPLIQVSWTLAWTLATCVVSVASVRASAQTQGSLAIDAALAQPKFPPYMPISMSPDGRNVAYTLCVPDSTATGGYTSSGVSSQTLGCSVWVANAVNATSVRLAGGAGTTAWAPEWSPDGKKVAFYSDQNGVARLWVWVLSTNVAAPVSDAVVRPYATLETPRWTPDSRGVVTRILPYGASLARARVIPLAAGTSCDTVGRQPGSTVRVYRTDSAWRGQPRYSPPTASMFEGAYAADLALIHIETGSVQTLARGYKPFAYWVSPDGKVVALTSEHGVGGPANPGATEYLDDLIVVPTDSIGTIAPRLIASQATIVPFGTGVSWSPDGRNLVYSTADSGGTERYHVVRTGDWSERTVVAPDPMRPYLKGRDFAQPLRWDPASKTVFMATDSLVATLDVAAGQWRALARPPAGVSIVALVGPESKSDLWEPDGASLVVESRNDSTKRMGFATVNLRTGEWKQITEAEQYLGSASFAPNDVAADGRHLAFISESATEPPDIWIAGTGLAKPHRITTTAPSLAGRQFGKSILIAWHTAQGARVRGAILLPVGYEAGRKYPLIIYPYPQARRSNWVFRFGFEGAGVENMQLFATRGYAVLAPDARVNLEDQMRSLAEVLLPGVDRAIEMGIADSSRLGVMGHSWGGYTVLALLVQTNRFRAAIMRAGVSDYIENYGEMEPAGSSYGQIRLDTWFGTPPWRDMPRYIDNSPVFFLDRVHTPLLIIQGGADGTVPPHNGSEVFADLRRLGQIVEYAAYDGENHGEPGWSVANQRDYLFRLFQWFGKYLSPTADSDRVGKGASGATP